MDLELKSRTAVVTGASIGIGRAIAKGLALEGVRVVAVARRKALLAQLVQEVEAAGGRPLFRSFRTSLRKVPQRSSRPPRSRSSVTLTS